MSGRIARARNGNSGSSLALLQDVFWVSMAVTIMFGLAFATVLTMVLVPVLYAILYHVQAPKPAGGV